MTLYWIIQKDLMLLTRDRRALAVLVLMPMVFIAILGVSTGQLLNWQNENATIRVALTSASDDNLTQKLVSQLRHREGLALIPATDAATARLDVDQTEADAAIIIGPGFKQNVKAVSLRDLLDPTQGPLAEGLSALDITVYTRTTRAITAALTEQLVWASLMRVLPGHVARHDPLARAYLTARAAPEAGPTSRPAASEPAPAMAAFKERSDRIVYQIIVPAYTVLFAFFIINIMARSFLSEQHAGTLDRLLAAPIGTGTLILGKTIPFFIISVAQGVLLFIFGKALFGMSWGPMPGLLLVVIACTSMAAVGLGLLTSVLVRTDAQVSAYANLLVIALAGLSGCFMPREWLPASLKTISLAIPHAWSLIAYDQLLNSPQPNGRLIATACAVLVGFSLAFLAIGSVRFRQLYRR